MRFAAVSLLALLLLSGCGGAPPKRSSVKPVPARMVVHDAKALIGVRYRYGGIDPRKGFDCSGLVWYIYHKHGSAIPRRARDMFQVGSEVSKSKLQPGDLVFFNTDGSKLGHVGIYMGDGRFLHAPATGGWVREDELANNYWRQVWAGARRIE